MSAEKTSGIRPEDRIRQSRHYLHPQSGGILGATHEACQAKTRNFFLTAVNLRSPRRIRSDYRFMTRTLVIDCVVFSRFDRPLFAGTNVSERMVRQELVIKADTLGDAVHESLAQLEDVRATAEVLLFGRG